MILVGCPMATAAAASLTRKWMLFDKGMDIVKLPVDMHHNLDYYVNEITPQFRI